MTVIQTCPSCGLESDATRCPRCNALKVVGCSGSCSMCGSSCEDGTVPSLKGSRPSDESADDVGATGTPLER